MVFKTLNNINISPHGSIQCGMIGSFMNPDNNIQTYLYERCVLKLIMRPLADGLAFYEIGIGGFFLKIFDNSIFNEKYLDMTEVLASQFAFNDIQSLTSSTFNHVDYSFSIKVSDEYGVVIIQDSTDLRTIFANYCTEQKWLPDELNLLAFTPAAISVNTCGTYNYSAIGVFTSIRTDSFTSCKIYTDGEIVGIYDPNIKDPLETCKINIVPDCGHIQLWWLSKDAGGWKTAAFDILSENEDILTAADYVKCFTKLRGKDEKKVLNIAYRNCSYRTAHYLSDIVSSDMVLFHLSDNFISSYEYNVIVSGNITCQLSRRVDIELSITVKEGDWL